MIADAIGSVLVYTAIAFGFAWPLAARFHYAGPEKVLVSVSLSLTGIFLLAWAIYVFALPRNTLWILPFGTVMAIVAGRSPLRELWRDDVARELIVTQLIVTGSCVGWQALVISYSGGFWIADWFGHWQRVEFFLERGPRDILFNGFDPLTSRPPLGNVVVGALLAVTRVDFAHYQLATTVLSSLAFLPAAMFAHRFGGGRVITVLAVGLLLNPMFIQNTTFAWTKMPAAFFTLTAIHFFLRSNEDSYRSTALNLCAVSLGAALLTHYSAGPYALILVIAWVVGGRASWSDTKWWRTTLFAALFGALLLACWFGWSFGVYGSNRTLMTNTSVTDQASSMLEQLRIIILNIRDTLVPHFLRRVNYGLIAQPSSEGWWRDWFFQLYQVNLFFGFGCVAWLVLGRQLIGLMKNMPPHRSIPWVSAAVGAVTLGVAVHTGRNVWGLAHICLQPVILLGLAFLATRWHALPMGWGIALGVGAIFDFCFGILLHFGIQSFLIGEFLSPNRSAMDIVSRYSTNTAMNFRHKLQGQWTFLGDELASGRLILMAILALLLILAILRMQYSKKKPRLLPKPSLMQ
jgi:hypothetical protein